MQMSKLAKVCIVVLIFGLQPVWASESDVFSRYQTQESLEPDIWATVWLIAHVQQSDGRVLVEATPQPRRGYRSFGYQGAEIFTPGESYYMHFLKELKVTNPTLISMGDLVSSVEKLGWTAQSNEKVSLFESEFRQMQAQYGRYWVPVGCYKQFFDRQYSKLAGKSLPSTASCELEEFPIPVSRPSIPTVPIQNVLQVIGSGKKVVFVDTRESSEFQEKHIPGAINIPFRHMESTDLNLLTKADMVVPYCIKDFRGFEAARRLQEYGIQNVSLLDPFGLAGWIELDLPVAGAEAMSEMDADKKLAECVQMGCLKNEGGASSL